MKGSLTFTLPEDECEFQTAINAPHVRYAVGEYMEWMRSRLKYETLHEEQAAELATCRDKFFELVGPHLEE